MIAFFLAAVMVCSTFGSASVTAYASGSTEPVAVVEETTATESSEMVSEEGEEAVSEEISEEESMISSEEAAESDSRSCCRCQTPVRYNKSSYASPFTG